MPATNQTGYQQLTVGGTAVSLTLPTGVHARPTHALIQVRGAPVRWLATPAAAPTANTGFLVPAGDFINWLDDDQDNDYYGMLMNVQFVLDASAIGPATLEVGYFS